MQKKLLAAAVLSAFAGVASAQSSSVTIYGTLIGDFQFASATGADSTTLGAGALSTSSVRTAASYTATPNQYSTRTRANPAGSNVGFRGSEDLGNGLSAWFQLEMSTTLGPPSGVPDGANHGNAPTWRNTAVGLRSNSWGTVAIGMWDTPFNVVFGSTNVTARTAIATTALNAGLMGATMLGQGAWSAQNETAACVAGVGNSSNSCMNASTNFDRRQKQLLQWWSPNWNGFEVRAAYAANAFADGASGSNANLATGVNITSLPSLKPTIWDLSATYNNGPLVVAYAYSRQKDLLAYGANAAVNGVGGTLAAGTAITGGTITAANAASTGWNTGLALAAGTGTFMNSSTGTGHRIGGKYALDLGAGSKVTFGALWESLKYSMSYNQVGAAVATTSLSELKKSAYRLQAAYEMGNHFIGFDYTRAGELKGSVVNFGGNLGGFNGGGTGAKAISLTYAYSLSKRTSLIGYYIDVRNDTNATYGGSVFAAIPATAGADPKYIGAAVRHAF